MAMPAQRQDDATDEVARSLAIARRGIKTSTDVAQMASSIISDVIEGKIAPNVANAAINATGKLLKVVEMTYLHGKSEGQGRQKVLTLVPEDVVVEALPE